jgi:hypothetical protein
MPPMTFLRLLWANLRCLRSDKIYQGRHVNEKMLHQVEILSVGNRLRAWGAKTNDA